MNPMVGAFKAELIKLTRPRALMFTGIGLVVFAAIATSVAFLAAETSDGPQSGRGTSIEMLSKAGGGTEAFALGMSFTGFFVFVVLTANWAGEFSQGTFRTLLMKQPRRMFLLGGKLAGLLAFAAVALLAGEVLSWLLSLLMAPANDVSTSEWFTSAALGEAASNYGNALLGVSAWATFGMTLGLLLRSTPIALGIGIAWAGPFEHITQEAWTAANGTYPGLLLEALAVGGTDDVSYVRAIGLIAVYVALAVAVSVISFTRRDMVS